MLRSGAFDVDEKSVLGLAIASWRSKGDSGLTAQYCRTRNLSNRLDDLSDPVPCSSGRTSSDIKVDSECEALPGLGEGCLDIDVFLISGGSGLGVSSKCML